MAVVVFGLFFAAVVVLFRSSVDHRMKLVFPHQAAPAQRILWVIAIVVFFAILEIMASAPRGAQNFAFVALLAATFLLCASWFAGMWKREFLLLMSLRDDEMPGRHDKLIWTAVFIAFAPFGPWLFRSFRRAHLAYLEPEAEQGAAKGGAVAPEL